MIFTLNKLLFQPIIRTLDNRKEVIVKSQKRVVQVEGEVERLKQDFQQKLNEVRSEVLHLRNVGHEKGMASRESMILEERKTLQEEFENNFDELSKEIKALKMVRQLTLSGMLSEAIRRVSNEESISAMFD